MLGVGKADRIKLAIFLFFLAALGWALLGGARSSAQQAGASPQLARATASATTTPAAKTDAGAATASPARVHNNAASPLSQQAAAAAEATEGCVACHNNIEPMHVTSSGKL